MSEPILSGPFVGAVCSTMRQATRVAESLARIPAYGLQSEQRRALHQLGAQSYDLMLSCEQLSEEFEAYALVMSEREELRDAPAEPEPAEENP